MSTRNPRFVRVERDRLIRLLEAIDDGDRELVRELAGQLGRKLSRGRRRFRCQECGADFRWPGELDRHHLLLWHEVVA